MLLVALIPFYVAFVVVVGFFIFISPGLLNSLNRIPRYQFVLCCLYLVFIGVYPALYAGIMLRSKSDEDSALRE
jgi:hypothetical protein